MARVGDAASELDSGTLLVVPSITFPAEELAKITAAPRYEERTLFVILLLRQPDLRLVFVTSQAVDPAIVDYYLRFVPDARSARRRLHLVSLDDPSDRPLSEKLLQRPEQIGSIRDLAAADAGSDPGSGRAYLLTFNVTPLEQAVAEALDLPLFGPAPELARLGSKSGSRQVARRAGVAVLPGTEDLFGVDQLEQALADLRAGRPDAEAVVIKLNNGFSGQGNAIVHLDGLSTAEVPERRLPERRLPEWRTTFCASEESWASYSAKVAAEGAVVEELVRRPGVASPSVQLRVLPSGRVEVLSTHDQVLGGPAEQVYLGCRFPAHPAYRAAIVDAARRVGAVLAGEGVIGSFGIDFLAVPDDDGAWRVYLSEINLRMGGTTHTFWMARLATGGSYDESTGELVAGGRAKLYVASDNVKSARLVGVAPAEVIAAVDRAGLAYDRATGTGATLHLLGALPGYGKMGMTCIADTREDADELYRQVLATVTVGDAAAHTGR